MPAKAPNLFKTSPLGKCSFHWGSRGWKQEEMMETSHVFQCGDAPDSQEEDGGILELEERLVARGVLRLPLYMVLPERPPA